MSQQAKVKCPGCGTEFNSKNKLTDHVVEKHDITCQICGEKLNIKEKLIKHNKERHGFKKLKVNVVVFM